MIKKKAVEVVMSDGSVVVVHEPETKHMGIFLRALPHVYSVMSEFVKAKAQLQGEIGNPPDLREEDIDGMMPLLAVMSDMSVEDYANLPLWDGIAILMAISEVLPEKGNPPKARSVTSTDTPQDSPTNNPDGQGRSE
jgi:hypothetical protein